LRQYKDKTLSKLSRRNLLQAGATGIALLAAGSAMAAQEPPAAQGGSAADSSARAAPLPHAVRGADETITIETDCLAAKVQPRGYTSGIKQDSFIDRKTGAGDGSYGLDIVDFLMEPGAEGGLPYEFNNAVHGKLAKHYVELPQLCTQAKRIDSAFVVGRDFVAVRQGWRWTEAAPGLKPGSLWEQTQVFPMGCRYVLSSDRVESVNAYKNVFLRLDMPGHIRHKGGDTFEEVYLSYEGRIAASDFAADFPPDARHLYQRSKGTMPERFIRARKIRGAGRPWLAGMTLDPRIVYEAWCHQRGYVCFIEEIGGVAMRPGDSFAALHLIGYFDDTREMETACDRYQGMNSLAATKDFWLASDGVLVRDGDAGNRWRLVAQGDAAAPARWKVLAHGQGEAVLNGRPARIEGDQIFYVPSQP
jgi:hypothetical protein